MKPQSKRTRTEPGLGKTVPEPVAASEEKDKTRKSTPKSSALSAESSASAKKVESRPLGEGRQARAGPPIDRLEGDGHFERVERVESRGDPSPTSSKKGRTTMTTNSVQRPGAVPPSRDRDPDTGTRRRTLSNRAVAVDPVGASAKRAPDAVGAARRQIPHVLKTRAEIAAAPIDHRAGFLLAHIDGKTAVQALVDIAGMPEADVHEILERLRRLGIVAIR